MAKNKPRYDNTNGFAFWVGGFGNSPETRSTIYKVADTITRPIDKLLKSKPTTSNPPKTFNVKPHHYNPNIVKPILVKYEQPINYPKRHRIDNLADKFITHLLRYTANNTIIKIKKTKDLLFNISNAVITISRIVADSGKYELIAEIIDGEATISEHYSELKPFFDLHIDLLKDISNILKN